MKNNSVIESKNFLPLLSGIIAPVLTSIIVLLALYFGLPLWFILSGLAIFYAVRSFTDNTPAFKYLKNFITLLVTLVAIVWVYHFTGMLGIYGLLLGVLIVAGILVYKRRRLILDLVRLWEKTFLGETMEERIERRKHESKNM